MCQIDAHVALTQRGRRKWPCDRAVDTLNILRAYPGLMEEIMLLAI